MKINNNQGISQNYAPLKKAQQKENNFAAADVQKSCIKASEINSNYFIGYNNISFRGKNFDKNIRKKLQESAKISEEEITAGNSTQNAQFFKTRRSEFALLPDNNKIYKLHYTEDKARIFEQVAASKLYNALGIRTPEYMPFEKEGKNGYLTEVLEEELEPVPDNSQALYNSFVADAWLMNRNGLSSGNTMLDKNGNIVKLSVSGALSYRARGEVKKDDFYKDYVAELSSMRDFEQNPEAAKALNNMKRENLSIALDNFNSKYSYDTLQEIVGDYTPQSKNYSLQKVLNWRAYYLEEEGEKVKGDIILEKRGVKNIENLRMRTSRDTLLNISDKKWELLKSRGILDKNDDMKEFDADDLSALSKIDDETHRKAVERNLYKPMLGNAKNQLFTSDIISLAKLDEESWQTVQKRGLIKSLNRYRLNMGELREYLNCNDKTYQALLDTGLEFHSNDCFENNIRKFNTIYNDEKTQSMVPSLMTRIRRLAMENEIQKRDLRTSTILDIASLDNKAWEKASGITNYFRNLEDAYYLPTLASLSDEEQEIAEKRGLDIKEYGDELFKEAIRLSDEVWENIERRDLKTKYNDGRRINWSSVFTIAQLTDEEYKKAQDNGFFEPRCDESYHNYLRYLSGDVITQLVRELSDDEFQNIQKRGLLKDYCFFNENNSYLPAPGWMIGSLACMSDGEFEYFKQLAANKPYDVSMNPSSILDLALTLDNVQLKRTFDRNLYYFANQYEGWDCYTNEAPIIKTLSELDDNEYQSFLSQKNRCKTVSAKVLILKLDKLQIKDKNAINELTFKQKKEYLDLLISRGYDVLSEDFQGNYPESSLVPSCADEYTKVIDELVKSVGINAAPLSDEQKTEFYSALKKISSPDSDFSKVDFENKNCRLNTKYPREKFIQDMEALTSGLEESEKMKIWDYYGFELSKAKTGETVMSGFPALINNGEKLNAIENSNTKNVIEKMKPYIENFTKNNAIIADGTYITEETAQTLNAIYKAYPELYSVTGKKQHSKHDYTVDIHTLNVLQKTVNNPDFQKLDEKEKMTLMLAAIFHDIDKTEDSTDGSHVKDSAYSAFYLLEKLGLDEGIKTDVYQLIKSRKFLNDMDAADDNTKDKLIKRYAFELRSGNLMNMEKILTKSDMLSVQRGGKFYELNGTKLEETFDKLNNGVEKIQNNAIMLPRTNIPKASEVKADNVNVFEVTTKDKDGNEIKNKVLYLSDNLDLEKYGFAKGVNSNNLNVLVHAFDTQTQQVMLSAIGLVDKNALLSTSYVCGEKGNYHVFRPFGYIMDTTDDNIGAAYYRDFGSGFKKNVDLLLNYYINGSNKKYRDYIPNLVKQELHLSDKEYKELYKRIKDKPMDVLEKEEPEVANAYKKIFENMEICKRKFGRDYNEILVTRGVPKGIFFEGKDEKGNVYTPNDIPEFLRKYAQDNDLLIVNFGA